MAPPDRGRDRPDREDRLNTPGRDRSRIPKLRVDGDTFGAFAEAFARFMGTARFLMYMTVFILIWIVWNVLSPTSLRFDEYPFIFLTLILSLQASYAAPLILLAQNRQEARDRISVEEDRRVAAQSRADMEFLAREIASVRMNVGELATRDFIRNELRNELREALSGDGDERSEKRKT
ncbi:DUF1003 domain-containing protein [Granulicoccus sp. GXG6511]|uniref:DUF1003 domain-containing protein n=1 Tax=Granulicoccus sp. GXG6511 TaxID=3381351 RepID=UPI003D7D6C9E